MSAKVIPFPRRRRPRPRPRPTPTPASAVRKAVIHGDSLARTTWSVWKTPAHIFGMWDYKLRRDYADIPTEKILHFNKRGQSLFDFELPKKERVRA